MLAAALAWVTLSRPDATTATIATPSVAAPGKVVPVAASAVPVPAATVAVALPSEPPATHQAAASSAAAPAVAATKPAKESTRDKRTRETREREARAAATPVPAGVVRLAVSPWGQVEVDGAAVGTVPPLTEIMLPQGKHRITIRNEDFPPYSASVQIAPGQPVTLKHKFGS